MPALKVSSDQRAELRSQAHALKPVVLVGAEGLTDAVLAEIKVHLAAHQLIKIRVFGDEREERIAIYEQICDQLNAAPIQHIGKLLVIWKPETEQPAVKAKRGALPSAREAAVEAKPGSKGRAPRVVTVVKPSEIPMRKPKAKAVVVRGNERVTQGGNIKRAKKRQTSAKRAHQSK
ncbi:RNA-binding protein [Paraburkholderia ginsengiterrae]|uniref:RNA-binding protein n=1 Tax=Paraburkholderia ginsengiterrae TaxID=1462993 RepID=A0A1A9NAQ0_9BURK|nr:YhbY family RNA-binding protein [Paraburkholderia ginsengiterrae]OAJ58001.1 RNA-binding protein [Paraburkholderia ginsengiterrae]OAJ62076.1 RNA-binding protein [Paraburkholderia ginsengiterrae]